MAFREWLSPFVIVNNRRNPTRGRGVLEADSEGCRPFFLTKLPWHGSRRWHPVRSGIHKLQGRNCCLINSLKPYLRSCLLTVYYHSLVHPLLTFDEGKFCTVKIAHPASKLMFYPLWNISTYTNKKKAEHAHNVGSILQTCFVLQLARSIISSF